MSPRLLAACTAAVVGLVAVFVVTGDTDVLLFAVAVFCLLAVGALGGAL